MKHPREWSKWQYNVLQFLAGLAIWIIAGVDSPREFILLLIAEVALALLMYTEGITDGIKICDEVDKEIEQDNGRL